jgi:hypothetical protein
MCLSAEAFALFLNIIGAGLMTPGDARITVHATEGDVVWHEVAAGEWCTGAPYLQAGLVFDPQSGALPFTAR